MKECNELRIEKIKLEKRCGEYHDLVETRTIEKLNLEQQKAELLNMLRKVCQHNDDIKLNLLEWGDLFDLLNKYKEGE